MRAMFFLVLFFHLTACTTKVKNSAQTTDASPANDDAVEAIDVDTDIDFKATTLLAEKCAGCHNAAKSTAGFGDIEDTGKMIASGKYIVVGKPEESLIYKKTDPATAKPMPPTAPLTEAERELIKNWILSLADPTGVEAAALAILKDKCASCHDGAAAAGGFSYVTDADRMIASNKYIVLANPEESAIYKRTDPTATAVMPPAAPLTDKERATILEWIKTLKAKSSNYFLSDADFLAVHKTDLEKKVAPGARPGMRYFTLHHMKMAQISETRIEAARQAFFKTINSISLSNLIVKPVAIDAEKLIYRVNLFDIEMPLEVFESLLREYSPFTVDYSVDFRGGLTRDFDFEFLFEETQTKFFVARADWFAQTVMMPPIYQKIMNLPDRQQDLETQLGVQVARNIDEEFVQRSGFRNSGVSENNRVIEHHVSLANRSFWLSYDFLENQADQNVFIKPLGPSANVFAAPFDQVFANFVFQHDGGEIIFELPNGLHGYYLSNAAGDYIHKGPIEIVRNKQGPENFVLAIANGVGCMDCHKGGIINKDDQVRLQAANNPLFTDERTVVAKILALYPDKKEFTSVVDQDNLKYAAALKQAGVDATLAEDPVKTTLVNYYEDMALSDVAAELGVTKAQLLGIMRIQPFADDWAVLLLAGGTISREDFNLLFGLAQEALKNNLSYVAPRIGDFFVTSQCMELDKFFMDQCVIEVGEGTRAFGDIKSGKLDPIEGEGKIDPASPSTAPASGKKKK